jgi:hypothetical protein
MTALPLCDGKANSLKKSRCTPSAAFTCK